MQLTKVFVFLFVIAFYGCNTAGTKKITSEFSKGTYGYDAAFLKKNLPGVIELKRGDARLLLSAACQGRVMTSTAANDTGASFGWINYDLISSGEIKKQFNPVGGEERFWLGPEGGQYSIYFNKGDSFSIDHWQVPPLIDTESFSVDHNGSLSATFSKEALLTNYSGSVFNIHITRRIDLLDKSSAEILLQTSIPDKVNFVAYTSNNQVKNSGQRSWNKEGGLLSIWLLAMMTPTSETKVIIPFTPVADARGYITDNYFGAIPADRLLVLDSILYFRCDGKSRGKIGISPQIAKPVVGSFDFKENVLTILILEVHKEEKYVNSKWEIQNEPYKGDVINSYNDGPLEDGSQLGPFYEIESSSAARELAPGDVLEYSQSILHFQGNYEVLKTMAKKILGADLDDVRKW